MPALSAEQVTQRYRRLRPRLLLCMATGYAAFYLTRKSLNYVLPALQLDLGLSKSDIGLIGSLFYLSYGLSKFAAGLWHDSKGQRAPSPPIAGAGRQRCGHRGSSVSCSACG